MAKRPTFTERDLERLREMSLADIKRAKNTQGRGPSAPSDPPSNPSAESYIARTRFGGIPGMEECDSTSPKPGYAYCDVYEVVIREELVGTGSGSGTGTATEFVHRLVRVPNFRHRVYNADILPVDGDSWVFITKDNSGKFFVVERYNCSGTGTGSTGTGTTGTGTTGTGSTGTGTDTGTGTEPTGTGTEEPTGTGTTTGTGTSGTGTSTGTGTEPSGTGTEEPSGTGSGTGTDEEPTGTGTGTGTDCITIPGVDFSLLPIVGDPDYVLGIKDGCLVRVPVGNCNVTGTA